MTKKTEIKKTVKKNSPTTKSKTVTVKRNSTPKKQTEKRNKIMEQTVPIYTDIDRVTLTSQSIFNPFCFDNTDIIIDVLESCNLQNIHNIPQNFVEYYKSSSLYDMVDYKYNRRSELARFCENNKMKTVNCATKSKVPADCSQVIIELIRNKTAPKMILSDIRLKSVKHGTVKSLIGKIGGVYRAINKIKTINDSDRILSEIAKLPINEKAGYNCGYLAIAYDQTQLSEKELRKKYNTAKNMLQAVIRYSSEF